MSNPALTQEILQKLLDYDPETGALTWKERDDKRWNGRWAGKKALDYIDDRGYRVGNIYGKKIAAHRVLFCLAYGRYPECVDHINGVRSDNRLSNLREATKEINAKNAKTRADNNSGVMGVHFNKRDGLWMCYINSGGRRKYLGTYGSFEEAASVREKAETDFEFHPNHGRSK